MWIELLMPKKVKHRKQHRGRMTGSAKGGETIDFGDYGIQAAIKKHYKKRKWPKPAMMEKIAKPWVPYRSVACWYLWRSLDVKTL